MSAFNNSKSSERGSVLIAAIAVLAVVGAMAFIFRESVHERRIESEDSLLTSKDRMNAMAALDGAIGKLRNRNDADAGFDYICPETGWIAKVNPVENKNSDAGNNAQPQYSCTVFTPENREYLSAILYIRKVPDQGVAVVYRDDICVRQIEFIQNNR